MKKPLIASLSASAPCPASLPSPVSFPPLVRTENLCLFAGGRNVLANISFTLEAGQHLSIIGPNGAGKSTLLRCLLGLIPPQQPNTATWRSFMTRMLRLRPDVPNINLPGQAATQSHAAPGWTGRVTLQGRDLAALTPAERARLMAYVPQSNADIPPFTVYEFAMLARYAHNPAFGHTHNSGDNRPAPAKAHTEVVDLALRQTDLWMLRHRALSELSGGERQKAYLAAALAQEPVLLLLDEPAAFLDPAHDEAIHALLRTLRRKRKLTLITVSHDLNRVLLADGPVLAIRNGLAQWFDRPGQLTETCALNELFATCFLTTPHPQTQTPVIVPNMNEARA